MKISKGIYDNVGEGGYSVKVVKVTKKNGVQYADMYFTNHYEYGKSHFGMEGKYLQNFLKGSKKRK